MGLAGGGAAPGRSVTSRALGVLGAFDARHRSLTLSDIAARAALPLTTTHRLVAELAAWQALHRRDDGRYVIGQRLWQLGLLAPVQQELREVASPFLHDVHAATGEVVQLAVREGASALYVDRVSGSASVPVVNRTGTRLPLHATGVGKVLLAHAPAEVLERASRRLARVTPHTIVEPARLARELAEVRRRGYARTAEEMSLGTGSVAVPVADRRGRVVAALGVVAAARRNLSRLVPTLHVAAAGIGRHLGS